MKQIRKILAALQKADESFNLIEDGDKIVVGISGGKDSLTLIKALSLYQGYCKAHYELYPVTLDLGFPDFDPKPIKEFVSSLGMELIIEDATDICKILELNKKNNGNLPCSICSRMRKASINKVAKRLGANKVAFAHHADDAIETKLMNELFGGREATFAPKMLLERSNIVFIRPFILLREKEIIKYCKEEGIEPVPSGCPNDKHTEREEMKTLLNDIYRKYPRSYQNLLTCLSNESKLDLFYDKFEVKIDGEYVVKPVVSKNDLLDFLDYVSKKHYNITPKKEEREYFIYKKGNVGVFTITVKDDVVKIENIHVDKGIEKEVISTSILNYFTRYYYPKEVILH